MERLLINELVKWKESKGRKPLLLNGARQVGKTWLLQEFGRRAFKDTVYIHCDDKNTILANIFNDLNPQHIIESLEAYSGKRINSETTLIILDEIQEIPRALTSLKYFCEEAPQYNIAVAGSLLGLMLHTGTSFPVGKVDIKQLFPMSFSEFLLALGEDLLYEKLQEQDWAVINTVHDKYIRLLQEYFYVGGMPEAVKSYVEEKSVVRVREIQETILLSYRSDFSKHAPREQVERINQVYRSIPAQLAKENKKFTYGVIKEGARAKDFELAVQWLIDAGLVLPVARVSKPQAPLRFYEDFVAYKLYLADCGLLGAMNGTSAKNMLLDAGVFTEYKGAFIENFVLQELMWLKLPMYYYAKPQSRLEIDFLTQVDDKIIPIEAKSGLNLRSQSLNVFRKEHSIELAVKTSILPYKANDGLVNLPIYAVQSYFRGLKSKLS